GMGLFETDTVLAIVPLFHANAWGLPYPALMSGANLLTPDRFLQPGPPLHGRAAPVLRRRGADDLKWDERPLVAVVLAEGAESKPEELREFLVDKFAKWQLPERWTFIAEVPKTSVGKFDKKRLRSRYADRDLDVTTLG
ncbi:AMP-binding enzyme, partial [Nocardia tengchongensis]